MEGKYINAKIQYNQSKKVINKIHTLSMYKNSKHFQL